MADHDNSTRLYLGDGLAARDEFRWKALGRVYAQFHAQRSASAALRTADRKLRELRQEWDVGRDGPFPYDGETYDILRATRDAVDTILHRAGGR